MWSGKRSHLGWLRNRGSQPTLFKIIGLEPSLTFTKKVELGAGLGVPCGDSRLTGRSAGIGCLEWRIQPRSFLILRSLVRRRTINIAAFGGAGLPPPKEWYLERMMAKKPIPMTQVVIAGPKTYTIVSGQVLTSKEARGA